MRSKLILLVTVNLFFIAGLSGQARIRIFSKQNPESVLLTVTAGRYELMTFNGPEMVLVVNESVFVSKFNGRLAVKKNGSKAFECDSLLLRCTGGNDLFSVRINNGDAGWQSYAGDLQLFPDLGTILMINITDIESYIAGVVKSEGGPGRNKEYLKTQAIFARTYFYRHFERHLQDRYNLCDGTHCQAFHGITTDSRINQATRETSGLVILDRDSMLVISAFHSNCGGETSVPENVWLTGAYYLKSIADPYCRDSHNARWVKKVSLPEWTNLLVRSGYKGKTDNSSIFAFTQNSRMQYYRVGSFSMPFNTIREDLNLRSAFFSVIPEGDSLLLKGKGYGHGVGLCQEGAMSMSRSGHNFRQIINFYYSGVIITEIRNALILHENSKTVPYNTGM